jgi:uncharacterized protein (DUF1697 family)
MYMPRYIAFLRAINVGGHTVTMDKLRSLFEALGFANVETFIASGNVIFESPSKKPGDLERKIETHLEAALGYEVATFLRTPVELSEAAKRAPFGEGVPRAGHTLYVSFLKMPPDDAAVQRVTSLQTDVDRLHVVGRELYWLRQGGHGDSKLSGASIERALKAPATARNIKTVRKLAAKYAA